MCVGFLSLKPTIKNLGFGKLVNIFIPDWILKMIFWLTNYSYYKGNADCLENV
jgi:hypothetical protein